MADLRDDDFIDSLRVLSSDSSVGAALDTSTVLAETYSLFGRPTDPDEAATFDLEVERYASHQRVQYWINFFTTRARRHFEVYLERAGRYDSMIRTRLAEAGMPQDLVFLAMIESGFNQSIISRAGAVGLWQFMPSTGRMYGLAVDAWVDDRRDPYAATNAAIRMLSELNHRFGSMYLAAAAYNSGPGRIQRGLARHDFGALNGDDLYFALAESSYLRLETRDYVPKLIAAAIISKEPARFGFADIEPLRPQEYDSVQVRFAVGLDVVARIANTTTATIEDLNARFLRGVTPPDRTVWVRVPAGTADSVAARLLRVPASSRITFLTHVVVRGETLSRISRQYHVSIADIRSANHLRGSFLRRGQRLIIPTSIRTGPRSAATARTRTTSRATTTRAPAARATTQSGTRRVHVVRSGETLWGISQQFSVSLDDLLRANSLTRRSVLRPGQTVRIP